MGPDLPKVSALRSGGVPAAMPSDGRHQVCVVERICETHTHNSIRMHAFLREALAPHICVQAAGVVHNLEACVVVQ